MEQHSTQQLFFFKTHFASDPKQCLFGWVQLIFWPFLSLMFDHDRHHDLKPSLVFRLLVPVFTSPFPPSSCCAIEMCPQYKQQLIKREQQYQPYYQDLN